jgi:hypothetical protein
LNVAIPSIIVLGHRRVIRALEQAKREVGWKRLTSKFCLRPFMVTLEDIKKTLPQWPDEVIGEWLIYFANDGLGWPPPEPYGDHRWGVLLGHRPVSWS